MALNPDQKNQVRDAKDKQIVIDTLNSLGLQDLLRMMKFDKNDVLRWIGENMDLEQLKKFAAGDLDQSQASYLIKRSTMLSLINDHNPYTNNESNDMTIFVGNPDPSNTQQDSINQVELEVDGPYAMAMEWNFKGSPQKINKTIRIKYRYRAKELGTDEKKPLQPPHWVTAYLLVGYEDGGA